MGEEHNDEKKMKYDEPRLVNLNRDTGAGMCGTGVRGLSDPFCIDGSGESIACGTGNSAGTYCVTGNAAGYACYSGGALD